MVRSAKDIFADALELRSGDRTAFVDAECAGDGALRAEVDRLLASHGRAGEFLGQPTVADGGGGPPGATAGAHGGDGEEPGGRIGPYKLLQQIGVGGFGVVYMAEQDEPVVRRVALKIVKLGMDTRQVVARFDQERQALAMMDHPNIARVLDAGATPRGRPYFVMELVKGDAITEYCDRNHLTIPARLELFGQVCRAVQHAHTKGVIHRDLKPSNVLVSTHDGRAVAKVIDFGIAKATAARLTERTLFTEFRQLVGTPQYMSPEQADGSLDIDTRTDVYSLGVLLYELITGLTPFDPERLRSAAYGELQRIIREEEPQKPSTRLSSAAQTLATVAALRHTDPRALTRGVRGDLDWIVMKAMEKDRARRYETAEALAADVERHANDEPVAAGPPGRVYRARKLIRRHRGAVGAAGAVGVALAGGLGAAVYGLLQAERERATALGERAAALRSAEKLEQVQGFFVDRLLGSGDLYEGGSQTRTVLEAVDAAALGVGSIPDAEVRAAVEHEIGAVYLSANRLREAREHLGRALEVRRGLSGDAARADATRTMLKLAGTLTRQHEYAGAQRLVEDARAQRAGLFGPESLQVAEADYQLAEVLYNSGRRPEAMASVDRALARVQSLERPGEETTLQALMLAERGRYLSDDGRYPEAVVVLEQAVQIRRRVEGQGTAYLAAALAWLSNALGATMEFDRARAAEDEAAAIRRRLALPEHPMLAQSLQAMGLNRLREGDIDGAVRMETEALAMYERAYPAAKHPQGHEFVALAQKGLARALLDKGAPPDPVSEQVEAVRDGAALARAAGLYEQAIGTLTRLGGEQGRLASARGEYGRCLMLLGRREEAEQELLAAHRVLKDSGDRVPAREYIEDNLVKLYMGWGKPERAAEWRGHRTGGG